MWISQIIDCEAISGTRIDMATRRQEKVARIVKEVVSDAIANHLNDPRIGGFVSVTRVDMSPDLRNADVYLSIFERDPVRGKADRAGGGKTDAGGNRTFTAITHARSRIQSLLARRLQSKFCPVLRFRRDEKLKKTLETMKLIDQAVSELRNCDSLENDQD
jgi:ribosome-binding factor A